jgi:hypothetical protein
LSRIKAQGAGITRTIPGLMSKCNSDTWPQHKVLSWFPYFCTCTNPLGSKLNISKAVAPLSLVSNHLLCFGAELPGRRAQVDTSCLQPRN